MKKKITAVILVLCLTLGVVQAFAAPSTTAKTINVAYGIKVMVNGQTLIPKDVEGNIVDPFVWNGTTYVPIRAISDALGAKVGYDATSNVATIDGNTSSSINQSQQDLLDIIHIMNFYRSLQDITEAVQTTNDGLKTIYEGKQQGVSQYLIEDSLVGFKANYIDPIINSVANQMNIHTSLKKSVVNYQSNLTGAVDIISALVTLEMDILNQLECVESYCRSGSYTDYQKCVDNNRNIFDAYYSIASKCIDQYFNIYSVVG